MGSAFVGALIEFASSLVGKLLIVLGLGFIEYQGVNYLLQQALIYANGGAASLGSSSLAQWAGFLKIDVHISIALSAITAKIALNSWINGAKQIVSK